MLPGTTGCGKSFGVIDTNGAGATPGSGRDGWSTVLPRTWLMTCWRRSATRSSPQRGGGGGGSRTSMLIGTCRVWDADGRPRPLEVVPGRDAATVAGMASQLRSAGAPPRRIS